jgi:hypothetical protein
MLINQYTEQIDAFMFTSVGFESTLITRSLDGSLFNDYPGF